jgi:hypothetical protein
VILGVSRRLVDDEELVALRAISDHLLPGRWDEIRPPTAKERAATITLALSLAECSVKIRDGGPEDLPEDLADPVFGRIWAGHVPVTEAFGDPIPCPATAPGTPVPAYIRKWRRR